MYILAIKVVTFKPFYTVIAVMQSPANAKMKMNVNLVQGNVGLSIKKTWILHIKMQKVKVKLIIIINDMEWNMKTKKKVCISTKFQHKNIPLEYMIKTKFRMDG